MTDDVTIKTVLGVESQMSRWIDISVVVKTFLSKSSLIKKVLELNNNNTKQELNSVLYYFIKFNTDRYIHISFVLYYIYENTVEFRLSELVGTGAC